MFAAARSRPLDAARKERVLAGVTPDEEVRLLDVGRRHALAYVLAGRMGLRRNEVAGLRWADVDTSARTLTVRAGVAKGRRESVLPLTPDALAALQEARGAAILTGAVVGALPSVRTLRLDWEAAGVAFDTEDGRADFHALRHSCATILARAGVAPQLLADFMRHRSYATTRACYQHLRLENLREVAKAVGNDAPDAEPARVPPGVTEVAENGAQRGSERALGAS